MTEQGTVKLCRWFLAALAALILLPYPLALAPPGIVQAPYQLVVPVTVLAGLAALAVVAAVPFRTSRFFAVGLVLFGLSLLVNSLANLQAWRASVEIAGHVLLPLAVALAARRCRLTLATVSAWGGGFWLLQVLLGLWALFIDRSEAVGSSGNRNWMAATLLALLPWACAWVYPRLRKRLAAPLTTGPGRLANDVVRALVAGGATALVCGWPTVYLLLACRSRGAWLGLCVTVAVLGISWMIWKQVSLFRSGSRTVRWQVCVIFVLELTTAVSLGYSAFVFLFSDSRRTERLITAVQEDIRLPVWVSTTLMIADHDFAARPVARLAGLAPAPVQTDRHGIGVGVGPGQFTGAYVLYRNRSTYARRRVAAPVTIHPHNELLNVGAQLGCLAAAAWLLLLLPLLRLSRRDEPLAAVAALAALPVFVHGFFDMTLVQAPSNLLAFFALGLTWRRSIDLAPVPTAGMAHQLRRTAVSLLVLGLLYLATSATQRELRVTWHLRAAHLCESVAPFQPGADLDALQRQAFAHYVRAAEIDDTNIRAHLYAATVAVSQLHDPAAALTHLKRAQEIDPNFAHLNDKIANCLILMGLEDKALPYFDRECQLYPYSETAWQRLWMCAARTGQVATVRRAAAFLNQLHVDKTRSRQGDAALIELAAAWQRHVIAGDTRKALAAAEQMTNEVDTIFIDPLLYALEGTSWPADFLRAPYNDLDFMYWRLAFVNSRLLARVANDAPDADPVARLVAVLQEQIEVDAASTLWDFPLNAWGPAQAPPTPPWRWPHGSSAI
jgi:tetratricopeptide (TPR) repeat protein